MGQLSALRSFGELQPACKLHIGLHMMCLPVQSTFAEELRMWHSGLCRANGVVMGSRCVATCCHHRCDAVSYVNPSFLRELGLCETDEDFAQFVSTAGWAVGGQGTARDIEKRRYGMMAKRILDLGRVAWLQQELGLREAQLVSYIGKDVTPENIAIIAGRSGFHEQQQRQQQQQHEQQ